MTYGELKEIFCAHERMMPDTHLTAYISFSSFGPDDTNTYTARARTYAVSSNNKAFQPNKGGYSIFAGSLDGSDPSVRLERYMRGERGGEDGWIVDDCCIVGYLLTGSHEREQFQPQMFYSQEEATDSMLKALAKCGELEFDLLKAEFVKEHLIIEDDEFEIGDRYAWLNAGETGNWDWEIKIARIYSPAHILFGDVEDKDETGVVGSR